MSGPTKQLSWQPHHNSQTAIGRCPIVASYDMLGKQLHYSLTGEARQPVSTCLIKDAFYCLTIFTSYGTFQ